MSSCIGQIHDATKWLLPAEHYGLDLAQKSSTDVVKGGAKLFGNDYAYGKADKDSNDFGRWGENNLAGIGAVLGGMYGYGAAAGEGAGGATGGGLGAGDGAFLGEGVPSGVGAWDGAAGGMGLGFDPEGLGASASTGNLDIPGGQNGKMPGNMSNPMQGMSGLFGGGSNKSSGSGGGYGRQNLPLMQNEKTDTQKLAELLQALQQQDQGYA